MRRLLPAVAVFFSAASLLRESSSGRSDPVVGRWGFRKTLGRDCACGFVLEPNGKAKAWSEVVDAAGRRVVRDNAMRVDRWRRVDAGRIELTEVSEGNHGEVVEKVCYSVSFGRGGVMTLKRDGYCDGMYEGTYASVRMAA